MAAADMFAQGKRQVDMVSELGCHSADRLPLASDLPGRGQRRAGRLPRLSDEHLAAVEQALAKGPRANGFSTEMSPLARVGQVIEALTGVRYG